AVARHSHARRDRMLASPVRLPIIALLISLVYGTVGFVVLEGFSPLNALYMTVTTLTTVGFGEIEPLGPGGRIFTLSLIAVGFTASFTLLAILTSLVASGQLGRSLSRRTMRQRIDALRDHYIVCAFGRVGQAAVEELVAQGAGVVVVEVDPGREADMIEAGVLYLLDDPQREDVLEQAGIERARGLLCAVDSDAANVYITLLARARNPDLFIIGRASSPESVEALRRAGSDRVVSPYRLSGTRMAALAFQPAMLEFVDMVSVAPDLRIEELVLGERSPLAAATVREAASPYDGVMIMAVRSPDGNLLVPPRADTVLNAGDLLIVVGPVDALNDLAGKAR
ncbi:MAG TPA: potassium channel protein, partial [Acidimicrobiales bacterium]|nr:potassium channel protein [Acidimicrobiales bacterium]